MRIGIKIMLGFGLITISGAISGYLLVNRSQKSLNSINFFAQESIPELLKNHEIATLTEEMILNMELGKEEMADSLYHRVLTVLDELEEWEEGDDEFETLVQNEDEELALIEESKKNIIQLYETVSLAYSDGKVVDEQKARELLLQQKVFSDLSLERMKSEILEFDKNRLGAESILQKSRVEATTIILITGFLAIVIGVYLSKSVTYPLIKLEKSMESIISSGQIHEVQIYGDGEMKTLSEAFNLMILKIKEAFRVQGELNRELSISNTQLVETTEEIETQKEKIEEQNQMLVNAKYELEEINQTLESKVSERTQELSDTIKELNKTVSELDRFVYSASHDLSAPLKSVLGLINISKFESDPASLASYMERIEASVFKLEDVIKNLIDFSRNSRTETRVESIEMEQLIQECLGDLSYEKEFSDIEIINNIEHFPIAQSDRQRLRVILRNLLSNAIKYQDTMKDKKRITVVSKKEENSWLLRVEDNGIGIKQEYMDSVFKMFYRATEQSDGSGLGLYIVQESVKKLDGKIKVSSSYGQGTSFQVSFPNATQTVAV
ncbi:GHKL domain-containing protein [Fulvivirga sp. M361]|uniref:sensor histidine kinase n=1 Tax=Fulvivirga sp. M361 TaxID=2594266 RepID=UPI00117B723A|nr:ATP-binding protein [Fulvivirga sp. M361]TRX61296.1 GHKL domain-containing protein [Fulvivirga sp. M361]